MMPDLVRAISATVLPSCFAWSIAIGANTATWLCTTLVESHSPPMPTSITATSTGASAKHARARTVSASKKVSGSSPFAVSSASVISRIGTMSSQFSTKRAAAIGSPSTTMRSRIDTRCGLVMSPVRSPCARTMLSAIRAVEVLPFVPVTWITGYARCGSPRSSTARRVACSRRSGACSPTRARSAASTRRTSSSSPP